MYDPDKIKGAQTRGVLASAMADLTGHIDIIEAALSAAADEDGSMRRLRARGIHAEELSDARLTVTEELGELFFEFEALKRICDERLT